MMATLYMQLDFPVSTSPLGPSNSTIWPSNASTWPPRGHFVRYARTVHKVCTGPWRTYIVVPSTRNNEPCYAFI